MKRVVRMYINDNMQTSTLLVLVRHIELLFSRPRRGEELTRVFVGGRHVPRIYFTDQPMYTALASERGSL